MAPRQRVANASKAPLFKEIRRDYAQDWVFILAEELIHKTFRFKASPLKSLQSSRINLFFIVDRFLSGMNGHENGTPSECNLHLI